MMRKKRFKHWLEKTIIRSWYDKKPIMVLLPFACFFSLIVRLRRFLYQKKVLTRYKAPVPVIVVGNITVGGTGKTPCVIAIAHYLKVHGFNPGIISRGYRGCYTEKAVILNKSSLPEQVGDEPVLLKRRCDCPVVVSRSRQQAIELLLAEEPQCRVIISDDGLQHYRLARDIEYVVIDASRGVGNGSLLPAGPLREPVSRLKACDTVIMNQSNQQAS